MVGYLYPDCCQENLHPFGNKKGVHLVHCEKEISLIIRSVTVFLFSCLAQITFGTIVVYAVICTSRGIFSAYGRTIGVL